MRFLRSNRFVAQIPHWCDRCCEFIQPGDCYEVMVWLDEDKEKHRIVVFKYHVDPMCDYPPDPEDEDYMRNFTEVPWRLAA